MSDHLMVALILLNLVGHEQTSRAEGDGFMLRQVEGPNERTNRHTDSWTDGRTTRRSAALKRRDVLIFVHFFVCLAIITTSGYGRPTPRRAAPEMSSIECQQRAAGRGTSKGDVATGRSNSDLFEVS